MVLSIITKELVMKTVYLAGPIAGCTDKEAFGWRNHFKDLVDRDSISVFDPAKLRDYRGKEEKNFGYIVESDKKDIMASNILLANVWQNSVGTSMEILFAWEQGKVVILVADKDRVLSPWYLYHSHYLFRSVDDAAKFITQGGL